MDGTERLLLSNGLILAGTGAEGWLGSVLIEGGRIAAVAQLREAPADSTMDCPVLYCSGLAISPGFIDQHSH